MTAATRSHEGTCRCNATWTGKRAEHCSGCCQTFSGTTAGDAHRVGRHDVFTGPERRRCLTPDEMRAKGMRLNKRGMWSLGGTSPWAETREDA